MPYKDKERQLEAQRRHYRNNKKKYKLKAKRWKGAYTERNREWILQYLSENHCVDCGENRVACLQFDHVRGVKKDNVATLIKGGYSLETVKAEVEKCEVRCANCHAIKTALDFEWYC